MARGNVPVAPTPGAGPRLSRDKVVAILTALSNTEEWGEAPQKALSSASSPRAVNWRLICIASDLNKFAFAEVDGEEFAVIVSSYTTYIDYDSDQPEGWAVFTIEGFPDQFWRTTSVANHSEYGDELFRAKPHEICEVYERVVVNVEYVRASGGVPS